MIYSRYTSSFLFILQETVSKYKLEVDDGNKKVDETIEIDTEKETETFRIPSDGDTSSSSPGDVDVVYDFKRVSDRE